MTYDVVIVYPDGHENTVANYRYRKEAIKFAKRVTGGYDHLTYRIVKITEGV